MGDVTVWMPFYVGDYLRDTLDLSRSEHGSYLLSICAYWSRGESLPDLAFKRVCGRDFGRIKEFYVLCDGRWHHKRIDEELAKAREFKAMARSKAQAAARARWSNP